LSICISRKCIILALFLSYVNVNGLLMNDEHIHRILQYEYQLFFNILILKTVLMVTVCVLL
jgi:hypothetical protein